MKKKNGFTLIELLVTIALMLSLLAIAIVSVVNVSKKKKEEAYQTVKEQVLTATKEFVDANEYLFESLNVTGDYRTISLQELVENDYLNVLTNPMTGKKLNECVYVKVSKSGGKYEYTYVDNDITKGCNTKTLVTSKEPGGPSISVSQHCTKNENNPWCISDVEFKITPIRNSGVEIASVGYCYDNTCNTSRDIDNKDAEGNYLYFATDDTRKKDISFRVTNKAGKYAMLTLYYQKDSTVPTLIYDDIKYASTSGKSVSWTNQKATFNIKAYDTTSGIDNEHLFTNRLKSARDAKGIFYVKWNNKDENEFKDYYEDDVLNTSKKNINKIVENGIEIYERTDGGLGAPGVRQEVYKVCDNAGNCTEKTIYANIDKEAPSCSFPVTTIGKIKEGNKVGDVNWYIAKGSPGTNHGITVSFNSNDNLSGVNTSSYENGKIEDIISDTSKDGKEYSSTVVDNAGNSSTCTATYGLEKSVKLVFDKALTNDTISYNPRTEDCTGTSNNNKVFNNDVNSNVCGYGNCSNIKCHTDSAKENQCPTAYFARSCEYVSSFLTYFNVTGASIGANVPKNIYEDKNDVDLDNGNYDKIKVAGGSRSNCRDTINTNGSIIASSSKYFYENCGQSSSSGQTDFTYRTFTYKSPAGNISNGITLYTEFDVNCNYHNYTGACVKN